MKHLFLLLLLSATGVNASRGWSAPAYKDLKYLADEANNAQRIQDNKAFALSTCALAVGLASCYHMGEHGLSKSNACAAAFSFAAMAKPETALTLFGTLKENVYNCGSYLKAQVFRAACCTRKPHKDTTTPRKKR